MTSIVFRVCLLFCIKAENLQAAIETNCANRALAGCQEKIVEETVIENEIGASEDIPEGDMGLNVLQKQMMNEKSGSWAEEWERADKIDLSELQKGKHSVRQGEQVTVVDVEFPVLSTSMLQSEAPFALLATKPKHVFTVVLDDVPAEAVIDSQEYMHTMVPYRFIPNVEKHSDSAAWQQGEGLFGALHSDQQTPCPSRVYVCLGQYPGGKHDESGDKKQESGDKKQVAIETKCACHNQNEDSSMLEFPTKIINVRMRDGLNNDDSELAIRQIAHLADKESKRTLLMVDARHRHSIRSMRQNSEEGGRLVVTTGFICFGVFLVGAAAVTLR